VILDHSLRAGWVFKVIHREKSPDKLHEELVIIDGLNISVWNREIFKRLKRGGVTAVNATTACWEDFRRAICNIEEWNLKFEDHDDLILQVTSVLDIVKAKKEGRVGIIIGFQNATPIEDDVGLIHIFWDLGLRIMQLTFQDRNYVGDGCWERTNAGLSEFGLRVIKELNRRGILIDLSHAGDKTVLEAIDASTQPVAFTHSNPRSLLNSPRNKTDEQIQALAKKGGVIGGTVYPPLLAAGYKSSLSDYLDVLEYLVNLVGVDHVGIGSDFTELQSKDFFIEALTGKSWKKPLSDLEYPIVYPARISSATELPNVTEGLLDRGYGEGEVKRIMGENWIRLYSEVWKA
jgi:membrane dipeptidase